MTHKRIVAALALAFALGIGISFVNLNNDPSASASDTSIEGENIESAETTGDSQPLDEPNLRADSAALTQDMELPGEPNPDDSSMQTLDAEPSAESSAPQTEPSEEPSTPAPQAELSGVVEVDNQSLLSQAIISSDVTEIVLTNDIVVPVDVAKAGGILFYRPLELAPLKLNLNGHNLTTEGPYAMHVFYGALDIVGEGAISAKTIVIDVRGAADPSFTKYTDLTIGKDVTLSAPQGYSIVVDNGTGTTAYAAHVEFNGTINAMQGPYVNGTIKHTENPVLMKIGDTAQINAEKVAVYAAGYANWHFGAAHISGETGIGLKAGTFELTGTTIEAFGTPIEPELNNNGMDSTGVVFQIEHNASYANEDIVMNINSGQYTSQHNSVFYEYGDTSARSVTVPADINISGGKFSAAPDYNIFGGTSDQNNIEITSGTFHGKDANDAGFQDYFVGDLKFDQGGNVIANRPIAPSRPSTSNTIAPEAPETPVQPSAPSDNDSAPETGVNQARGKISAVSTVAPITIGAICIIALAFGKKLFSNIKSFRAAEVECEINAEIADIVKDEPEPVIERFVATKIERNDPTPTPVDMFIPSK